MGEYHGGVISILMVCMEIRPEGEVVVDIILSVELFTYFHLLLMRDHFHTCCLSHKSRVLNYSLTFTCCY